MSSSPPQKVTFSSFKKEEVRPQPSPASEFRPARYNRFVKIGFKSLVALNLGLCAYILLTEPPKRRRDMSTTAINDATRSDLEMLPENSTQSAASF